MEKSLSTILLLHKLSVNILLVLSNIIYKYYYLILRRKPNQIPFSVLDKLKLTFEIFIGICDFSVTKTSNFDKR